MIILSKKKFSFYDFDWQLYNEIYPHLKEKYVSRYGLWWHYVNIGEQNGYIFTDNKNKEKFLDKYESFDWEFYLTTYPKLLEFGFTSKYQVWHHYISMEKTNTDFFRQNKTIEKVNKKTLYYFIDHVSSNEIRTGIQIVTIFLAKELLLINQDVFDIIFVKWSTILKSLIPCDKSSIDSCFNNDSINYTNYLPIHLNKERELIDCVFFCPELTFVNYKDLPEDLNKYLNNYKIKSIFILYDIIPIILKDYFFLKENFQKYINHNLLNSDKIITISEFTKNEFINYAEENNLFNINFPVIKSISLPYQYRNMSNQITQLSIDRDKIIILLPGTIEKRKQQILLMKLFNKFVKEYPEIEVELIIFGNIIENCKTEFNLEINESNKKMNYLGIIDNQKLSKLYKIANFTCFISLYEGYGLPISESLWHGVPVLTSNFGSMDEISKCGGCYSINTHDEIEIYEALKHLIMNPLFLEKLKNEIKTNEFTTWQNYSEKIYDEIIEEFK